MSSARISTLHKVYHIPVIIELSVMFFLTQLVTLGCELAMVFGGVVPYIPQYWQIKQKQTTQVHDFFLLLIFKIFINT